MFLLSVLLSFNEHSFFFRLTIYIFFMVMYKAEAHTQTHRLTDHTGVHHRFLLPLFFLILVTDFQTDSGVDAETVFSFLFF